MATQQKITLFYSPQSRSTGALLLLEELHAPYALHPLNMKTGEQRQPAYLAVNPMGKVPAVLHGKALITEQVAITIYLADLFPEAGITPGLHDALRGPYLRWLAFYGSCFEPAIVDKAMKREPAPQGSSPYGDYDTTIKTLHDQLAAGPWLLGKDFTAADVLWGTALTWISAFGLIEVTPTIKAYTDRWNARPSVKKVAEIDAALQKKQGSA